MTEWVVDMNNHEDATTLTTVYAVCGSVADWSIQAGPVEDNPAGMQSTAHVQCPSGTVFLSGAPVSSSLDTGVNMNSGFPTSDTKWQVAEDNSSANAASLSVDAVCAS